MKTKQPYKFSDLINAESLHSIMATFYRLTNIGSSIIDLEGNIIVGDYATGWRRICMEFHRKHPEALKKCIESDTSLCNRLLSGEKYVLYNCLNGMVDSAVPIMIGGEHVANLFSGQYFVSPPDVAFFREQADRYGFDEDEYLSALKEVPVLPAERVKEGAQFLTGLAEMIGQMALSNREIIEVNEQLESRVQERTRELVQANQELQAVISERERAEDFLKQTSGYARSLIEASLDPLVTISAEGKITDVNEATVKATGVPRDKLIGTDFSEYFTEPGKARAGYQQAFREGSVRDYALEIRHRNGHLTPVLYNASVYRDESGNVIGVFATARDITVQKQAEESLRESEQLLKSVLELLPVGVWILDEHGKIISGNRAGHRIWAGARFVGIEQFGEYKGWWLESRKPIGPHEWAAARAFEKGETSIEEEIEIECFDGTHKIILNSALPLLRHDGSVGGAIIVNQDITDRHLLQEERLKTQKLEAIGTLAGGIAHDFNNLLQGVSGYISLAKLSAHEPERSLARLEQAEKALDMAVNLTAQLLTFSKGGKPLKKRIALRPVIEYSASFALSGSRSNSRIAIDENLWQVEADEAQIGQVVRNIVMNASEAMPDGGTVEISAGNVDIPEGDHPLVSGGGKFVRIAIRDSGRGISKEHLAKIFDPYFSTKQKGSGLGLATSYSIIRNHGGMIEVTSESGRGSTFFIYLPASETEEKEEKALAHALAIRRKGRILLMDDEELIRNVAKELIEALGHEIECAANGEDAVEKFRHAIQSGVPFDVVILDLTVKGGMGGEEAIKRLLEIDPEVKAIVSSGYSENPVISDYRSYGFKACMNKPYSMEALDDNVSALLG